jgi:hypothetical protein
MTKKQLDKEIRKLEKAKKKALNECYEKIANYVNLPTITQEQIYDSIRNRIVIYGK